MIYDVNKNIVLSDNKTEIQEPEKTVEEKILEDTKFISTQNPDIKQQITEINQETSKEIVPIKAVTIPLPPKVQTVEVEKKMFGVSAAGGFIWGFVATLVLIVVVIGGVIYLKRGA